VEEHLLCRLTGGLRNSRSLEERLCGLVIGVWESEGMVKCYCDYETD
jgi:hypothetical protein